MIYYFFLGGGGWDGKDGSWEGWGRDVKNCHDVKLPMKCSFIHVKLQLFNTVLFVQGFFKIVYCVSKIYNYNYKR